MRGEVKEARYQVIDRHRDRLGREINKFQEIDRRYFWVRLGVLLVGALLIFFAYQSRQSSILLGAGVMFVVIFAVVIYLNRKVKRSILRFSLSKHYFANQLARMDLAWGEIPTTPSDPPHPEHPFASDLNITGSHSVHQLINTAISHGGSQLLQDWLLKQVPEIEEMRVRQATVRELQDLSGFRSRLALSSTLVSAGDEEPWDGAAVVDWLGSNINVRSLKPLLGLLSGLAIANIVLFVLFSFNLIPAVWMVTLAVYAGVYLFAYRNFEGVFEQAHHLSTTLERFRAVLVYLEKYSYTADSHLSKLCQPFWQADRRPSSYLRRIALIASASSISANPVIWILVNVFVPWDVFFAYQLQRYKAKMQDLLPNWLDVWYQLEALNSLANFAYMNPGYTFPGLDGEEMLFQSKALGHPLIPDEVKVCNDFSLQKLGEVVIVTGSNMSGKSTFLRTIGVNLCLAFTGAPVNADYLITKVFRLFTVIQVSDSLTDGISYFYAEVRRLKALLNALEIEHDQPLFFLIDEIFRGTNNRERQIGGRAFVKQLIGDHGVGLISTHDLELVVFADELPDVINFHFEEDVTKGRMIFDYLLRPGPSQTTNALAIMKLEGLPVNSSS
jgi:ABC-type multidrug transport system fused ATPase/permease subunit